MTDAGAVTENEDAGFRFEDEEIALPRGAWAKTHRRRLLRNGRTVLALTQGDFRSYLYPLTTPAGFAVTSERPADHPHHASLWVGSDHVHAMVPAAADTIEEYTYNFYVEEVFQGRAPGRILQTGCDGSAIGETFLMRQQLEWRGPVEWAAPEGRLILSEERETRVSDAGGCFRIDVISTLSAGQWPVRLGPTRHAYFNARVADSLIVANGGTVRDDGGRRGGAAITGEGARWIDFTGPVGGGNVAGISVIPHPVEGRRPFWFVADWGVITVGPFRSLGMELDAGATCRLGCTFLVHDCEADDAMIARIVEDLGGEG